MLGTERVGLEIAPPHVGVVTLRNPPVNAMGSAVREDFLAVMDHCQENPDIRAIVLTAEGKVFCAGADIKEKQRLAAGPDDYQRANRLTRDSFLCLLESRKPVIAAVNGAALGAGFIMATCCDMILAAEDAFFAMPEINVGQGGGASFLKRIMPPSKMRRMMLTGERVPADELYRLGVVEECLPTDQLLPAALEMAETIAAKSPVAVEKIRSAFPTVEGLALHEAFRFEQIYTTELSRSEEAAEARRAFFEKRG